MSDSVRPHRRQPTRLPRPWDSPGEDTGVGCHFLLQCVKGRSLSCVRLLATPRTAAYQAPLSTGFSRHNAGVGAMPSPDTRLGAPRAWAWSGSDLLPPVCHAHLAPTRPQDLRVTRARTRLTAPRAQSPGMGGGLSPFPLETQLL